MGMAAGDYPEMPSVDGVNDITLPQKTLRSMINQTIFAVATSDVRPIYTGTLFEIEDKTLTVVSVDAEDPTYVASVIAAMIPQLPKPKGKR